MNAIRQRIQHGETVLGGVVQMASPESVAMLGCGRARAGRCSNGESPNFLRTNRNKHLVEVLRGLLLMGWAVRQAYRERHLEVIRLWSTRLRLNPNSIPEVSS